MQFLLCQHILKIWNGLIILGLVIKCNDNKKCLFSNVNKIFEVPWKHFSWFVKTICLVGSIGGKMGRLGVNWVSVDCWRIVDPELINQPLLYQGG